MKRLAALCLFLPVAVAACGEPRTASEAAAALRSSDADERAEAAWEARDNSTASAIVQPLIAALSVERDPAAKIAILGALGRSGAPQARPWLQAYRHDPNPEVREAAEDAIQDYLVVTGEVWPTVFGRFPAADPNPPPDDGFH